MCVLTKKELRKTTLNSEVFYNSLTYSVCCCLRTFIVKMWSTPLFQCRIFLALFRNKKPNKLHWDCFTHYSLFQGYNAPHLLLLCCAFWATFLNPEPSRSLFCSFLADILWRSLTNFRSFLEWSNIFFPTRVQRIPQTQNTFWRDEVKRLRKEGEFLWY